MCNLLDLMLYHKYKHSSLTSHEHFMLTLPNLALLSRSVGTCQIVVGTLISPKEFVCRFVAAPKVASVGTKAEIASLKSSSELQAAKFPHMAARIDLEWACMQSLPAILQGTSTIAEVLYPGGLLKLVEPIGRDPVFSIPYHNQMACITSQYIQTCHKVRLTAPCCWKVSSRQIAI